MQSKIKSFFKPKLNHSSAESQSPSPITVGFDDGLEIWEKTEHRFINSYKRRDPRSNRCERGEIDEELIPEVSEESISEDLWSRPESVVSVKTIAKKRSYDPRSQMCERGEIDEELISEASEESISEDLWSRPESAVSVKTIAKKRSYAQLHLEMGQSDFLLRECSTCGLKYAPGDKEDENNHKAFHRSYTHGIQFRGWRNERVVQRSPVEGGRIILVLDSDPRGHKSKIEEVMRMMEIELGSGWILHKLCKVYLFISSQRIVGCLVAEPIKEAFKVLSHSIDGRSESSHPKEARAIPTTLQFGQICFQREYVKNTSSTASPEVSISNLGAVFCENDDVPAICGIRAIWVTPSNRRKHIATQLLDAARKHFCNGFVLEPSQLAFSQPTAAGNALASNYSTTGTFLVYKSNNSQS